MEGELRPLGPLRIVDSVSCLITALAQEFHERAPVNYHLRSLKVGVPAKQTFPHPCSFCLPRRVLMGERLVTAGGTPFVFQYKIVGEN